MEVIDLEKLNTIGDVIRKILSTKDVNKYT